MKTLVFTIAIGDHYTTLSTLTRERMENYAQKIGADFLIRTTEKEGYITQKWNKFEIYSLLTTYSRIIYLDIDILIREDAPNLFDLVPPDCFGAFDEGKYVPRLEFLEQASAYYQEPLNQWNGAFYNTGVMVVSRIHKELFKVPQGVDYVETDQPLINLRINNNKVKVYPLHPRFNRMDITDSFLGVSRLDAYFIHYAGAPRDEVFHVIKKDLSQWETDSPEFKYDQNILIQVSAGMGDQLCAEPAIRAIIEEYPKSNVYVLTHFPRLFSHLPCAVMSYKDWVGLEDPCLVFHTCPEDRLSNHSLSHVHFHPVDFSTISTIRKTLPPEKKSITLSISAEEVASVYSMLGNQLDKDRKSILVHAGKGWASKTFPVDWWQSVVNLLSDRLNVILIGKAVNETQGYVDIKCPENGIDLRDLTNLGEYIALISLAKGLLSNDSSPIHIAGAFDNWIITIPTCKRPEHILPYRHGEQGYKTAVLYKRLLFEDLETKHTAWETDTIDIIPKGHSIYEYIPEPEEVAATVFKIYEIIEENETNYEF